MFIYMCAYIYIYIYMCEMWESVGIVVNPIKHMMHKAKNYSGAPTKNSALFLH